MMAGRTIRQSNAETSRSLGLLMRDSNKGGRCVVFREHGREAEGVVSNIDISGEA